VWKHFGDRGQGTVVASIDTGVQYTHPALVKQYRGNLGGGSFDHNYNWWDPSHVCPPAGTVPCDNVGHGTHTMGTMVGRDGINKIGVAPKATWIAAKGCENTGCTDSALLSSGQFILAPTRLDGSHPKPGMRPDVVNNSWAGDGANTFYRDTVNAWVASGIFPQFSAGSSGPTCGTVGAPGSYENAYATGAYDINNNIASFSSRGPSALGGGIKPNIAAPGVGIRSSVPTDAYAVFSGTSTASPHVAGTVALLISENRALRGDISGLRTILDTTATDKSDLSCGGTAGNNNVYGQGLLNAFAAVGAAKAARKS
jgi:subtilisin family serine protease